MCKKQLKGYKYTLHKRLRNLSVADYEIAMKWFPERLGIHTDTFRKWIHIPADSTWEIPGTAIMLMALFFECSPFEMYSEPLQMDAVRRSWQLKAQQVELDERGTPELIPQP